MYKGQIEMVDKLKKFFAENEEKMQLSMKKILNESLNNNDIRALFFECENVYSDFDIMFYAIDNVKKIFLRKKDIMDEINNKHLFLKSLAEEENEIDAKYEDKSSKYEDFCYDYYETKKEIVKNRVILCWDNIKGEYNDIPDTFFLFENDYAINLNTKKELTNNERMKLMKSMR